MRFKQSICNIFLLFLITQYGVAAGAAPLIMPGDQEEQRQKARQEREERQDVFLRRQARSETEGLPKEAVRFQIKEIILEGKDCQSFPFVKQYFLRLYRPSNKQQAISSSKPNKIIRSG